MKRIIITLIGIALLAGACAQRPVEEAQEAPDRPSLAFVDDADAAAEPEISASTMFDFEASELFTGQRVRGDELLREGPMVVTFIDPTCPVCLREGPLVADRAYEHPDVTFVVIHGFSSVDKYLEFIDITDIYADNAVHLVDPTGALWNRFAILSQPATLVVDESGGVTAVEGAVGEDGYEEILASIDS